MANVTSFLSALIQGLKSIDLTGLNIPFLDNAFTLLLIPFVAGISINIIHKLLGIGGNSIGSTTTEISPNGDITKIHKSSFGRHSKVKIEKVKNG